MRINKIIFILLLLLAIIGLCTRFYNIETVPPHLSNDEISIAYDSYSINQTKKDEHNQYLPISFKSHGTYKAPGYAYILSPLYSFFQNNNTTARLPSIIFGLLTVFIFGLIVYELTDNKIISLISSTILLSSPWHIITSRMVLESNLSLLFLSLAILFFLKSIPKKKFLYIFISILFFAISMYCYHTEWVLSPLLLILMLILFYRKNIKTIIISLITFFIVISPLFLNFISNLNTSARANTEIIWKGEYVVQLIQKHHNVFLNPLIVAKAVFENYLDYVNINYLFFNGSSLLGNKNIYEQGLFLAPLVLAFLVGFFYLKKYIKKEYFIFFIIFIFLSPLVSSLTHGSPSLVRNLNSILPYSLVISIGIYQIIKHDLLKSIIFLIFVLISSIYFFQVYIHHYPKEKAESFQGYSPIADFLKRDSKNYDHIYIDYKFGKRCQFIGVPHLYLAYYQKLNPILLQKRSNNSFGKYTVTQIDWNDITFNQKDLYIVSVCNHPIPKVLDKLKLTNQIIDIGGSPAFEIWETK